MLFLSSLCLCLLTVTFLSQGDTDCACGCVSWCLTKQQRGEGEGQGIVLKVCLCMKCWGALDDSSKVTESFSLFFFPLTSSSWCSGPTPMCKLFLYLGYLLPSFNGQCFFLSCAIFFCIPRGTVVCGGSMPAVLIGMIHVEVDTPRLCLLFFVCWRVL